MAARLGVVVFALTSALGMAGCVRAPQAESLSGKPVRGDVAFYLVADDGAADARTVPVLRPYPGQAPRVALKPTPVVARGQVALAAPQIEDDGRAGVDLQLSAEGAQRLAEATRDNVGKRIAVVVNGAAVNVATIQGEIPNGRVRVAGLSPSEAADLQRELVIAK